MNRHRVVAAAEPQSRKQAGNAEHVVEMGVGQQDPVEPPEADAAAQQLTLGALAAIHQDALSSCPDQKPRMVAFRRRHAR
jgi:hypothetical protein